MKKLLLSALLVCIGSAAFAQTSQGTLVASGTVGYQNYTNKTEDESGSTDNRSFTIAPGLGYMIKDGLEAGINFGITSSKYESRYYYIYHEDKSELHSFNKSEENSFSISPYLKKYFALSNRIALTGDAYVSFSKGNENSKSEFGDHSSSESKRSNTGFGIGIRPGITFFPTEKIGLSASFGRIGYNHTTYKNKEYDYKSTSSDFGLNLDGSTLSFGFSYYISR